MVYLLNYMV